MSAGVSPRRSVLLGMAAITLLGWSLHGRGQEKGEKAVVDKDKSNLSPLVQGVSRCFDCHTKDRRPDLENLVALCECNEVWRWGDYDRHQDAYRVLLGPKAQRIGEIMNARLKSYNRLNPQKNQHSLASHSTFTQFATQ